MDGVKMDRVFNIVATNWNTLQIEYKYSNHHLSFCFLLCYYFSNPFIDRFVISGAPLQHVSFRHCKQAFYILKIQTKLCSLFLSSGVMCHQQLPTHSDCSGGSSSSSSTATAASRAQHGSASSQPAPCGESTRKVKWPPGKGWAELVVKGKWVKLVIQRQNVTRFFCIVVKKVVCFSKVDILAACPQQWSLVSVKITGYGTKVFPSVAPFWLVVDVSWAPSQIRWMAVIKH